MVALPDAPRGAVQPVRSEGAILGGGHTGGTESTGAPLGRIVRHPPPLTRVALLAA